MGDGPEGRTGRVELAEHGAGAGGRLAVNEVGVSRAVARQIAGAVAEDPGKAPDEVAGGIDLRVATEAAGEAPAVDEEASTRREFEMQGRSDARGIEPVPADGAIRIEGFHPGHQAVGAHAESQHIDDAVIIHQAASRARSVEAAIINHPPELAARRAEFHQDAGRIDRIGLPGFQSTANHGVARRIALDGHRLFPFRRVGLVETSLPLEDSGAVVLHHQDVSRRVGVVSRRVDISESIPGHRHAPGPCDQSAETWAMTGTGNRMASEIRLASLAVRRPIGKVRIFMARAESLPSGSPWAGRRTMHILRIAGHPVLIARYQGAGSPMGPWARSGRTITSLRGDDSSPPSGGGRASRRSSGCALSPRCGTVR
jgi:hypothetical protein